MAEPMPDGSCGVYYGPVQLEAVGGVPPYQWSACALPRDLFINPDGTVEGMPAFDQYGVHSVTVTADDNAGFTAYGVKDILIHAAVGLSHFYHGYTAHTGPVDVVCPDNDPGELRMIMAFVTRTTPGIPEQPTIAGWDFVDTASLYDTADFQAYRWDRIHEPGDSMTVSGVDLGPEWTGLVFGSAFYFGDVTGLVSDFAAADDATELSLPGLTPTSTSDAMAFAVAHSPAGLTPSGWQDNLGTSVDEFIGWPIAQTGYMQWPTENLAGPTFTATPAVPRLAGWTFMMPRAA